MSLDKLLKQLLGCVFLSYKANIVARAKESIFVNPKPCTYHPLWHYYTILYTWQSPIVQK